MRKPYKWVSFLTSLFVLYIFIVHEIHHDYDHKSPHHEIHEKIKILRKRKK